jgi:hypothetical protein
MHSLTIVFGPAATQWVLMFKTEEKAGELYNAYTEARITQVLSQIVGSDDFGQVLSLPSSDIHGMMLEDMELSQQVAIERGLNQARAQAKAQTRAMEDPTIKESIRRQQQGPAVYQPGMPMGPNGRMM